ncbi:MAG TPA: formyl transferase [Bacteroidales bacterium]|nr:formyl transferase [Bacteroidales bacterium]
MKIRILGNKETEAFKRAERLVRSLAHVTEFEGVADLAIAPLLTEILTVEELQEPWLGTLIFHPSPLPYGRGAASIKWAYRRKEPITAATWFWADAELDTGAICEQEIIKIDYSKRPREFYEADILPAMERTLKRCLFALKMGFKREVPQVEEYASFDRKEGKI